MHSIVLGVGLFLIFLISTVCSQLEPLFAEADGPEMTPATSNFIYRLSRQDFFNETFLNEGDPVRFIPSVVDHPDLPSWLLFTQRDLQSDGFLYGTPHNSEDSTSIQVVAINKNSDLTSEDTIDIEVTSKKESARYNVELKVLNYDLEEILDDGILDVLVQRLQQIWNSEYHYVTKVLSLRDVGARVPVPSEPGAILKEGVIIQIGGYNDFSLEMKSLRDKISESNGCQDSQSTSFNGLTKHFQPEFDIDWCSYKLINTAENEGLLPKPKPVILDGDEFDYSTAGTGRRNFAIEFGLIIIFPLVLMVIILFILSYIMFGRREGVETRDEKTPETQLDQFNTIRRATTNLRMMSHRRDGPPPLSTAEAYTPYSGSEAGTLPRSQAPPPYRLPPSYPSNSLSRRSGGPSRESTLGRYRGDKLGENIQLVEAGGSQASGVDNS